MISFANIRFYFRAFLGSKTGEFEFHLYPFSQIYKAME